MKGSTKKFEMKFTVSLTDCVVFPQDVGLANVSSGLL